MGRKGPANTTAQGKEPLRLHLEKGERILYCNDLDTVHEVAWNCHGTA